MVMGGDSRSEGREFESRCRILEVQFFLLNPIFTETLRYLPSPEL